MQKFFLGGLEGLHYRIAQRRNRALFDRCAGGERVTIGPEVWWGFHIVYPERLSFGKGTVINGECHINAQGRVRIGRACHIAKGLTLYSSNHNFRSEKLIPYDEQDVLKPVEIGDCVWVGANVNIMPGTKIGDGAIIAMGSVVRGDVPPCTIVSGNPAVIVGARDADTFQKLFAAEAFA
jgi:maltose O-acetyltransferase